MKSSLLKIFFISSAALFSYIAYPAYVGGANYSSEDYIQDIDARHHHHHDCDDDDSDHHHHHERGKRGKRGERGELGPQGISGVSFIADTGNTIVFSFGLAVTLGDVASATLTPYVVAPDGTITRGTLQPLVLGLNIIPSIEIINPEFGVWTAGLQVNNGISVIGGNLILSSKATRDTAQTNLIFYNAPVNTGLAENHTQTNADYVYSSVDVP